MSLRQGSIICNFLTAKRQLETSLLRRQLETSLEEPAAVKRATSVNVPLLRLQGIGGETRKVSQNSACEGSLRRHTGVAHSSEWHF